MTWMIAGLGALLVAVVFFAWVGGLQVQRLYDHVMGANTVQHLNRLIVFTGLNFVAVALNLIYLLTKLEG